MAESSNNPEVRSVLTGIRDAVVGVIDFGVDSSGNKSELWRIFYDSEIGSNVEKNVQKVIAVSVYKTLVKYFPTLQSNSKTVIAVSRTVLFLMDRSKLMYQYKHGYINESRYLEELTKRYAATLVAVIHRGEDFLLVNLPSLLEEELGIPRIVTTKALQKVFSKIELSEEKCRKIVSEGLRKVNTIVKTIDAKLSKALEPVREFIEVKIIGTGKKLANEVEEKVRNWLRS